MSAVLKGGLMAQQNDRKRQDAICPIRAQERWRQRTPMWLKRLEGTPTTEQLVDSDFDVLKEKHLFREIRRGMRQ